ncbi:hypothetical protein SUGI_0392630 [Cryptomeria japonica]|nr:hypothetical protein SUGI_0392630 [Cryptomeria japonica]
MNSCKCKDKIRMQICTQSQNRTENVRDGGAGATVLKTAPETTVLHSETLSANCLQTVCPKDQGAQRLYPRDQGAQRPCPGRTRVPSTPIPVSCSTISHRVLFQLSLSGSVSRGVIRIPKPAIISEKGGGVAI